VQCSCTHSVMGGVSRLLLQCMAHLRREISTTDAASSWPHLQTPAHSRLLLAAQTCCAHCLLVCRRAPQQHQVDPRHQQQQHPPCHPTNWQMQQNPSVLRWRCCHSAALLLECWHAEATLRFAAAVLQVLLPQRVLPQVLRGCCSCLAPGQTHSAWCRLPYCCVNQLPCCCPLLLLPLLYPCCPPGRPEPLTATCWYC
jgi:hypothetical protein